MKHHVMRHFAGLLLAIVFVGTTAAQAPDDAKKAQAATTAQASGQIQGKVVAAKDGKPIGSATVSTYRVRPSPVVLGQSVTAKDGTFTISALPAGYYNLCILDKSGSYANPCEWVDPQTQIDVAGGKTAGPITLSLKATSVLQVHVNDVANALSQLASDASPSWVLVTVRVAGGAGHFAVGANKSAAGVDYQVVVPFDTPLKLSVQSKGVALETASHAAVPAQGLAQDVLLDSSKAQQPTFVFNTTGRTP